MNKKLYYYILYLVFIFLIGALFGGVIEIFFQSLVCNSVKINGFLNGPFRPIYGWGSLLLHFIGKKVNKNVFLIFISSLIVCSLFEYISSFILELLFNKVWWDYGNYMFNINGRICLCISLCWGVLGTLYIIIIEPLLKNLYNKLNKKTLLLIMIPVFLIYVIDSVISIVSKI